MGTTRVETWEPCIRENNYSSRGHPTPQITITPPWGTRNATVDVRKITPSTALEHDVIK